MEIGIIYVIPVVSVILALLGWIIADRCSSDKIERELERDKKTADDIAVRADEIAVGTIKSKEHAERIRENQRRVEEYFGTASEAVTEAKTRSRNTIELVDECLAILEEAKKTEE